MTAETKVHRLSNGLRLATTAMPNMESAGVGIWTEAGSRHETAAEHGMAHFVEHLLFKGTPDRSAREISRQVESLGASLDAFTVEDHTCYHARCPADTLTSLIDVMSDMYQHPEFDQTELESEKRVIREEIAMVQDQPSQLLEDLISSAAWGETHPLGRTITGTMNSLDSFSRDSVIEYFNRAYGSQQTVISIAGKIDHQQVVDMIEAKFCDLPSSPALQMLPAPGVSQGMAFAEVEDREQVHLALCFRAASRHDPARFNQKILNVILGENMSSRLFQRLREQLGLCYEVQSDTFAFEDAGALQVYLALDPDNLRQALSAMSETFSELREKAPSNSEVSDAINYCLGQSRIHFETVSAQMMWAGECLLSFDQHIDPKTILKKLAAVTPQAVQESAETMFQKQNMSVALVGPQESINELEAWAAKSP